MDSHSQNRPIDPKILKSLEKYNSLRERLYDYFFRGKPLAINVNESIAAFSEVHAMMQNSQMKMQSEKKYESVEQSYFEIFRTDVTDFSVKIKDKNMSDISMPGEDYINCIYETIGSFTRFAHWTYKTFSGIDNSILGKNNSLFYQCLKILKNHLIRPLYEQLFAAIMRCLEMHAEGTLKSIEPLQGVIRTIGVVGLSKFRHIQLTKIKQRFEFLSIHKDTSQVAENVYETEFFKKDFINRVVEECKKKLPGLLEDIVQLSVPEYIEKVYRLLQVQEETVASFYPSENAKKAVTNVIMDVFIVRRAEELLLNTRTGLANMFKQKDLPSLKKTFSLYKRSGMIKAFLKEFQSYGLKEGETIIAKVTAEDEKMLKKQPIIAMLNEIIDFGDNLENIRMEIDSSEMELRGAQVAAFKGFCNYGNKLCTFLAYFVDWTLKRDDANHNLNDLVNRVAKLSKHFYTYDAFVKMHQKLMCIRILYGQFNNFEAEYGIINLLKSQAGVAATAKVTSIVGDYRTCEKWNQQILPKVVVPYTMHVFALTSGLWDIPDPKNTKALMPKCLLRGADAYEQQFCKLMPNRKLTWVFNHGRGILKGSFDNGVQHMLLVNSYQLLVLLHMQENSFKALKVTELLAMFGIDDQPLFMSSMNALVKLGVLIKEGNSTMANKIESKNDCLVFNFQLKFKSPKIVCMVIPKLNEKSAVNAELSAQRCILVDAAIIKVLKQKRKVIFSELVTDVQQICRNFKADIVMIKQRIQNCQQRDFLERDSKDMNLLVYKP